MIRWIIDLFRRSDRVSGQWLYEQSLKETYVGWEGPRWRLKTEKKNA